jgi:uncharacterized membrane protein
MFRYVCVATTAIIRLNMYWLLLIVITPFTTRMLSVRQQNLLRFGFTPRPGRSNLRSSR